MSCISALSTVRDTEVALHEVFEQASGKFEDEPADLAFVFASLHHAPEFARIASEIRARGLGRHVLGCTGESIIGAGSEIEEKPALSLWSIRLPGVTAEPLRLLYDGDDFAGWPAPSDDLANASVLLLGDPFTFPVDRLLKKANESSRGLRLVGGMASASQTAGRNRFILDDQVFDDGAVAVKLSGPLTVRTVVSQGCRPIGRHFVVTKIDRNLIRELGRRPALEVLREVFDSLEPDERALFQQGVHIGRVINEYQDTFQRGDFLVRNVLGADEAGGIAITDLVRVGQTIQFHVRDADTADEDLRDLLEREIAARPDAKIHGALLFSCNGRGTRLFETPHHDVEAVRDVLGPIPVAGFFAMGEIGPIGGQNFIHGYTASIVLFEEP